MKRFGCILIIYLIGLTYSCNTIHQDVLSNIDPGRYDSTWWNRAPLRLIQTNLPEIDAQMDVDAFVKSIVDASAKVVLLNVGGIVANYQTKLPFHYRNTFMKGDLAGELVKSFMKRVSG